MRLQERKGTVDGYEWRCRNQSKDNRHDVVRSNLNYLLEASVQFPPLYRWASADHQERPKECINQKFKEDIPISLKHENSKNAERIVATHWHCCHPNPSPPNLRGRPHSSTACEVPSLPVEFPS
ncbi:hypothetical protein TNCV_947361 [Trichonephila clavipes]|nr:hypothetical protein TNCV_947361 [Trichonephila clavipes]